MNNGITNSIKRGEIYYVDLGDTMGSEQGGKRPVVIFQCNKGNFYSPTTQVIPVTSQRKAKLPTHIIIGKESGLAMESIALVEQIRCIDKSRFIFNYNNIIKVGELPEYKIQQIEDAIQIEFGFNNNNTVQQRRELQYA